MNALDVFNGDAFSVVELTDAVNKIDHVPGRAGAVAFAGAGKGIATTTAMIEEYNGALALVQTTARGGPGQQHSPNKRNVRSVPIPHIQLDDTVVADSIQNVREFGSTDRLAGVMSVIRDRQAEMASSIDLTLENLRLGALSGSVKDADGTELVNLYTLFGVQAETEVDFALNTSGTDVRGKCHTIRRAMAKNLKMPAGANFGIWAFCSDEFFDALLTHANVKGVYDGYAAAERRLGDSYAYGVFEFGGIFFENYRGTDDGTTVGIASNKARFFPVGVPGLFREYYAPADYEETVNTIGLPRYSRQYAMPNGKGRNLEVQSNPLPICMRPKTLMLAKKS